MGGGDEELSQLRRLEDGRARNLTEFERQNQI